MNTYLHEETKPLEESVEIWYGQIAKTLTDFSQKAMVLIPDLDGSKQIGPCFWQARDSVNFPQRGHRCIVVFDNRGQAWVLAWWPFNG